MNASRLTAVLGCFCAPVFLLCTLTFSTLGADDKKQKEPGSKERPKESDALDIEKLLPKPLKLKVVSDAVVYNGLAAERRLGVIPKGNEVTVIAIHEKAVKVRGKALHDNVSGWVGRLHLQALDEKFMENLTKLIERQKKVAEYIAKNEVALGMTADETVQALGKPDGKNSKTTKAGTVETLEYITYKSVPQRTLQRDPRTGQMVYVTTYVRVESGRLSVTLENNVVTTIEDSETANPGGGAIVPGPIVLDMLQQ